MKYCLSVFLVFIVPATLQSQSLSTYATILGSSKVAATNNQALFGNPALLTGDSSHSFGINYKNYFGLEDLNEVNLNAKVHTRQVDFGIGYANYGIDFLRRQYIEFAVSRDLGKINVGASANYYHFTQDSKESFSALTMNLGMKFNVQNNLFVSIGARNIGRAKISEYQDERLESHYFLGTNITVTNELKIIAEVEHLLEANKTIGKAGVDYVLNAKFHALLGLATHGDNVYIGLRYKNKPWDAIFGFRYHQILGLSPAIGVNYILR